MYHSETAESDADESYQEVTDTDEEWLSAVEAVIMPPLMLNCGERSDPAFRINLYVDQCDEECVR